jgi:maltokinase
VNGHRTVQQGESAKVARRLASRLVRSGAERPITVDQTNTSVVVDEVVVVKWMQPPVPEPHPGVRLMAHLGEVGFDEMPAYHGHVMMEGRVTALVTEFVPGAVDGWEWYTDQFTGVFDGRSTETDVRSSAIRLGELAARLHIALATPSTTIPDPLGSARIAEEADRADHLLRDALATTSGEPGRRLAERADRIREVLDTLHVPDTTTIQPVHGDLHVGNVLRAGDRMMITDFDGNPLVDPDIRRRRRPAAADLASMMQSIDHVGRIAINRLPDAAAEIESLTTLAVSDCQAAYRNTLAFAGASPLLDERLLWPLRVAQELHEFVYAARHLPRWTYAPDGALGAMFP